MADPDRIAATKPKSTSHAALVKRSKPGPQMTSVEAECSSCSSCGGAALPQRAESSNGSSTDIEFDYGTALSVTLENADVFG